MSDEEWKPVVGFEGLYDITQNGDVWSRERVDSLGRPSGGYFLVATDVAGYKGVALCRDGSPSTYRVHGLVAEAFLGPIPEDKVVDHIDGDTTNNHFTNLRICSVSENNLNRSSVVFRNTTGYTGVHKLRDGRYKAYINVNGKRKYLCTSPNLEEAVRARVLAEKEYIGVGKYA